MYKSPIELIIKDYHMQIVKQQEDNVYRAVQEYGVTVDKEELVKALQYDRNQYEKGYKDAINDVLKTLEKVSAEYPYKIAGKSEAYSQYNEAWQDALDRVISEVEGLGKYNE